MKEFLEEFWLWIAVPFVLVLVALAALYFMSSTDGPSPFSYNVF